jgi:hypothetical protein
MSAVVLPENFTTAKLTISPIKTSEIGSKSAYVNYDGGKLILQTAAEMTIPYGLNVFKDGPKADNPDYSIDVSFKGHETPGAIKTYHDALAEFDNFILAEAYKNRVAWFKNANMTKEVIQAFYTPTIKVARDKEGNLKPYPPTQKIKLRKISGDFESKIYDSAGKRLTDPIDELLVKQSAVTVIIECGGLWFAGGKFGVTWRAKQIMINKSPERLSDFAFVGVTGGAGSSTVDDEKEDEMFAAMTKAPTSVPAPAPAAAAFNDVEVPEDEDEAEEVPAIKKPIAKKKVVLGKK